MIYVLILVAALTLGASWFLAKSLQTRVIAMVAVVIGFGAYLLVGRPDLADQPLSARLNELEEQARTSAESMTGDQMMALLQKRALDDPRDPNPHKFMGDLLAASGRRIVPSRKARCADSRALCRSSFSHSRNRRRSVNKISLCYSHYSLN